VVESAFITGEGGVFLFGEVGRKGDEKLSAKCLIFRNLERRLNEEKKGGKYLFSRLAWRETTLELLISDAPPEGKGGKKGAT